jgi:hypothetical protein
LQWLFCADSVVGLGGAVRNIAEKIEDMTTATLQVSLTINVSKTKRLK